MSPMSRRSFLGAAAAAGLSLGVSRRAFSKGQDKVVLEGGGRKYEWVKGWLKLPEGMRIGSTHGCVAIDAKDNVYFNTDTENAVITVDNDGKFIRAWGKDYRGGSHGMTIVKEGDRELLWLAHTGRHEIVKCTLEGEVLMSIPYPDKSGVYPDNKRYLPTSVAVAPNGDVYVGDGYGMHHAHRWNAKGEYLQSWNGSEGKAGKFNTPHGIAIDTRGAEPRVIVADRANGRLQYFTLDGKFLDVLTGFRNPCKVYVRGDDLLVPDLQGRITLVDKDNKILCHLGEADPKFRGKFGTPVESFEDGKFTAPHGAAIDSKGSLIVEDWNQHGRVNKLVRIA
jgi:hypothetical protein